MADGDGCSYSSEFSILSRARSTNKQKWFMIFYEISLVNVEDGIVRHSKVLERVLMHFMSDIWG